jgi:hypothetical protein
MMISCDDPLAPGDYVDIRRGHQVVIGRIVWRRDRFSGLRAQDIVDADILIREPRLDRRPAQGPDTSDRRAGRRATASLDRAPRHPDQAYRHEQSRILSSRLQFGAICAFAVAAAVVIAMQVPPLLTASTQQIAAALAMPAPSK